ncbi:MAG: CoA-binding protein [Deltaproteobacteria bacterium]|nr:CoA-binding protein [Deltaproteobacteria bacterium]
MKNPQCEIPDYTPTSKEIEKILKNSKRVAVVGLSPQTSRDSNKVARYLLEAGYDVIPVNPGQQKILERTCYKTLEDIPFAVDMANLFINPTRVPPVVEQCIRIGVKTIWMQLGIVHNDAASKAKTAGIEVVMNRCIMVEHQNMLNFDRDPLKKP